MTPDDFWYHHEYLFDVYMKAYVERMDRENWLQGVYVMKALESSIISYMPLAIAQGTGLTKAKYEPVFYPSQPFGMDVSSNAVADISDDEKKQKELELMKGWV